MYGPCMATKTITVDLTAYELLRSRKRPGQSFSDVIKEHLRPRHTAGALVAAAGQVAEGLSEETLDLLDQEVRARGDSPLRVPRL